MGIEDRFSLGGNAGGIHQPFNLLETIEEMAGEGVFQELWRKFLSQRNKKDKISWEECFIDGTFIQAKGGGKTKRGKGTKIMIIAEQKSISLGVPIGSASLSEMKLVEPILEQVSV